MQELSCIMLLNIIYSGLEDLKNSNNKLRLNMNKKNISNEFF